MVCDYFAGCLLVPKKWLRAAWTSGMQTEPDLARLFNVSREAIRTRLSQTGLVARRRAAREHPAATDASPLLPQDSSSWRSPHDCR